MKKKENLRFCSQCDEILQSTNEKRNQELCKRCEKTPNNEWLTEESPARYGDYFDRDPEDPMQFVIDSEQQALWIRPGTVFSQNKENEVLGIWIHYQNKIRGAPLQGPFLMSIEVWRELNQTIENHFKREREIKEEKRDVNKR